MRQSRRSFRCASARRAIAISASSPAICFGFIVRSPLVCSDHPRPGVPIRQQRARLLPVRNLSPVACRMWPFPFSRRRSHSQASSQLFPTASFGPVACHSRSFLHVLSHGYVHLPSTRPLSQRCQRALRRFLRSERMPIIAPATNARAHIPPNVAGVIACLSCACSGQARTSKRHRPVAASLGPCANQTPGHERHTVRTPPRACNSRPRRTDTRTPGHLPVMAHHEHARAPSGRALFRRAT